MGHHFSRIRRRFTLNMSSSSTNSNSSSDEDDPALAMVLAFMLRSGHMRVVRSRGYNIENDSAEVFSGVHSGNATFPNTIKDSDFQQKVLLNQGIFSNIDKENSSIQKNMAFHLRKRESSSCGLMKKSPFTRGVCTFLSSKYIPNSIQQEIRFNEKVFCGTYSSEGNAFLSACQDRHIRIYNVDDFHSTAAPFKDIIAKDVGWSVLDTAFKSDSRYLAYSSWSTCIHLCSVYDGEDPNLLLHKALDLQPDQYNFAVFSLQFTKDGNEILCGANDGCLYVYDLERDERTLKLDAHEDDINAVCFADSRSQIIYSGGDDGLVKVWDRRTLSDTASSPVGVLAGHQDGITFIDTIGDARYLISNSKDQSIKLWDIRQFSSGDAIEKVRQIVSEQSWDYRWQGVPSRMRQQRRAAVQGDTSVMTYMGHRVLNTLLRARFSPLHSTGNKYIYCGCSTGKVIIYDVLTGKIVSQLKKHRDCVRDVAWHPFKQELTSSSWDGSVKLWETEHVDLSAF